MFAIRKCFFKNRLRSPSRHLKRKAELSSTPRARLHTRVQGPSTRVRGGGCLACHPPLSSEPVPSMNSMAARGPRRPAGAVTPGAPTLPPPRASHRTWGPTSAQAEGRCAKGPGEPPRQPGPRRPPAPSLHPKADHSALEQPALHSSRSGEESWVRLRPRGTEEQDTEQKLPWGQVKSCLGRRRPKPADHTCCAWRRPNPWGLPVHLRSPPPLKACERTLAPSHLGGELSVTQSLSPTIAEADDGVWTRTEHVRPAH